MRYKDVNSGKENGVVYTPAKMAEYVASELIRIKDAAGLENISVLDPAVGKGELLIAFIRAVREKDSFAKICAVGYDIDAEVCAETKKKLTGLYPDAVIDIRCGDFLAAAENGTAGVYDFVIANPPYVRTQTMENAYAQSISEKLRLKGRIDIYYAFLICIAKVLKEDGAAGVITSNKFLTVRSGESVRAFLADNCVLHRTIDLGDTKPFQASVLPCLLFFSRGRTSPSKKVSFTSVYETDGSQNAASAGSVFDVLNEEGDCRRVSNGKTFHCSQGFLGTIQPQEPWTLLTKETKIWTKRRKRTPGCVFPTWEKSALVSKLPPTMYL